MLLNARPGASRPAVPPSALRDPSQAFICLVRFLLKALNYMGSRNSAATGTFRWHPNSSLNTVSPKSKRRRRRDVGTTLASRKTSDHPFCRRHPPSSQEGRYPLPSASSSLTLWVQSLPPLLSLLGETWAVPEATRGPSNPFSASQEVQPQPEALRHGFRPTLQLGAPRSSGAALPFVARRAQGAQKSGAKPNQAYTCNRKLFTSERSAPTASPPSWSCRGQSCIPRKWETFCLSFEDLTLRPPHPLAARRAKPRSRGRGPTGGDKL